MISPANDWRDCLQHAALSDIGMRRASNQDAYAVLVASSLEGWRSRGHLFVVADGMGAHAAGELASRLAVENIPHTYQKLLDLKPAAAIERSVLEANRLIYQRGQANVEFQGMGTTCSALLLLPEGALVAHVGDSRVYRLRGGRIEQLTFDHSLLWEMMAASDVSEQQLSQSVPKNVITRSLGPNPSVDVDLEGPLAIAAGDTYLLCSDGLCGLVRDDEIGVILEHLPLDEALRMLVEVANMRGGADNITVVGVKVKGPPVGHAPAEPSRGRAEPVVRRSRHAHRWLLGATGLCLLASALLWPAGFVEFAAASLAAAFVFAALACLSRWTADGPTATRGHGRSRSKGPYRGANVGPAGPLVEALQRSLEQLREALQEGHVPLAWDEIETACRGAQQAADRGDDAQALRQSMAALSSALAPLRAQRDQWMAGPHVDLPW